MTAFTMSGMVLQIASPIRALHHSTNGGGRRKAGRYGNARGAWARAQRRLSVPITRVVASVGGGAVPVQGTASLVPVIIRAVHSSMLDMARALAHAASSAPDASGDMALRYSSISGTRHAPCRVDASRTTRC